MGSRRAGGAGPRPHGGPFTLNRFAAPALVTLGRYTTLARFSTLQLILTVVMSIAAAPYGLVAIASA